MKRTAQWAVLFVLFYFLRRKSLGAFDIFIHIVIIVDFIFKLHILIWELYLK